VPTTKRDKEKTREAPEGVAAYLAHGLDLDWEGREQARGDCPFCGGEQKFHVNVGNSKGDCKACVWQGNATTFLQKLWEVSDERTAGQDYKGLAAERGLLYPETLQDWPAGRSAVDGQWLLPGYATDGRLLQLYRYVYSRPRRRHYLLATKGFTHYLFGVPHFNPKAHTVLVTEGPWDGMVLWETLLGSKWGERAGEVVATASKSASLGSEYAVLSTPSCNVFDQRWCGLFAGKKVVLLYDSDHPKNGQPSAGWAGMKHAAEVLACAEQQPESVSCIRWGPDGYDPDRKDGYDIRDFIREEGGDSAAGRAVAFGKLLTMTAPIPAEWVAGRSATSAADGKVGLECLPCSSWSEVVNAWRGSGMKWIEGLDRCLSLCLASVLSTKTLGDPIWLKVVSPASTGKSTLCEALAVAKKYVFSNSTMRGFHSGYKSDREGAIDHGLVPLVNGKTLVTKDGDTLLSAPNLAQILSEARDLYDCTCRVHYRHGVRRDYEDVRMTWILCGTNALRRLDSSELGERFLDCVIMAAIDEVLEREVNRRVFYRSVNSVRVIADGTPESRETPEKILAKQLTGGYVEYLRDNAEALLRGILVPDDYAERCIDYGTFVAYMRARPSKLQEEISEREFSSRLVGQLARLSVCLSAVLGKDSVDAEVERRVRQTALDTSRGATLDIARALYRVGAEGAGVGTIMYYTNHSENEEKKLLRFLCQIGVTEVFSPNEGIGNRRHYRLTTRLKRLYHAATGEEPPAPPEDPDYAMD
jgi:hypothetical protein